MKAEFEEYVRAAHQQVPGYFHKVDAMVFAAIQESQVRAGTKGDLMEIGVYMGRSAVILGYMRQGAERVVVCDDFQGEKRQEFERNYRQFHRVLPDEVIAASSITLHDRGYSRTFRFIHIDADHSYEAVRSDLLLSRELLVDGGYVVFDDAFTINYPGVAAAVWEAVASDGLIPQVVTGKLYASWAPMAPVDLSALRDTVVDVPSQRIQLQFGREDLNGSAVQRLDWLGPPLKPRRTGLRRLVPPAADPIAHKLKSAVTRRGA